MSGQIVNALTIDLEDWYQVANLEHLISFSSWRNCEDRLTASADRVMELLRRFGVRATFFVLGWNAERHPELLRRIADDGHELGTHGYSHRLIYAQSQDEFREELKRSIAAIENVTGTPVRGHRAASFSITPQSRWAFETLAECGIEYDSSVFPISHSRYGMPDAPSLPHVIDCEGRRLLEFPISTVRALGRNLPFAGGGYFRFLPAIFVEMCIRAMNCRGIPVMFYIHPWELDSEQPRMKLSAKSSLRCYHNIEKTESKLERLLCAFKFSSAMDVIKSLDKEALHCIKTRH